MSPCNRYEWSDNPYRWPYFSGYLDFFQAYKRSRNNPTYNGVFRNAILKVDIQGLP